MEIKGFENKVVVLTGAGFQVGRATNLALTEKEWIGLSGYITVYY